MSDPRCSCGSPLVCFSELAGRDELLEAARVAEALISDSNVPETEVEAEIFYERAELTLKLLKDAIKLAESRHPVEVAK